MASGARGGGAEHLKGLVKAQNAMGLLTGIVTSSDGPLCDDIAPMGVPVEIIEMMGSRLSVTATMKLRRAIRSFAPSIVHMHGTRAAWLVTLSCPGLVRERGVYTTHGLAHRARVNDMGRAVAFRMEVELARWIKGYISVSKTDLEEIKVFVPSLNTRGYYIPNSVDLPRFNQISKEQARKLIGIEGETLLVGTVGRLVRQKGVDCFVRALGGLKDIKGIVVGDGPECESLKGISSALNLDVAFLGLRSDVDLLLKALDVFVLSSRWEGQPIVLLEAMAAGVAVVASKTEGAQELIQHEINGLLFPIDDNAECAVQIERLRDGAFREKLREKARAMVGERSYRANAEKVRTVYGHMLSDTWTVES
ncbi:MAG: glycosyltransferase [Myxococcota bacterium]|nr:glycosyltransferase [Myxococcota bacterium]